LNVARLKNLQMRISSGRSRVYLGRIISSMTTKTIEQLGAYIFRGFAGNPGADGRQSVCRPAFSAAPVVQLTGNPTNPL
jgi:hypothetical protein